MDPVVVFDLRGPLAHFRRPDTLGTHASYPFPPRTALLGLVGAVLGLERDDDAPLLPAGVRIGLALRAPVRAVCQQLSLHGKTWCSVSGSDDTFHRPTTVELLVEPRYRVYFTGPRAGDLADQLKAGRSVYPTCLGSAFCLTVPEWVGERESAPISGGAEHLECATVVPAPAVGRLSAAGPAVYARVGGVPREHLGNRRFEGTTAVVYEVNGGPVTLAPTAPAGEFWEFRQVQGEGVVCLW